MQSVIDSHREVCSAKCPMEINRGICLTEPPISSSLDGIHMLLRVEVMLTVIEVLYVCRVCIQLTTATKLTHV